MIPTPPALSKALRRALTPKRGNKDFYKGTRQAFLPGAHRTGAPGKHVVRGKAKYRLIDEQVRVFVAPPVEDIAASSLKPYVSTQVRVSAPALNRELFGKLPRGGLSGQRLFDLATRAKTELVPSPAPAAGAGAV